MVKLRIGNKVVDSNNNRIGLIVNIMAPGNNNNIAIEIKWENSKEPFPYSLNHVNHSFKVLELQLKPNMC